MSHVRVLEAQSEEVLFTCSMEDIEKAYAYALELEALGVDVKIVAPSLPETLGASLGVSEEEKGRLRQELDDEVDSHNSVCSSCTYEKPLH